MTNKEKKEYLKSYLRLNESINERLEEVARLKALATKCVATLSDVPKGGTGSREDIYIKLIELNKEIDSDIDRCVDMKKEIESAINTVNDVLLRALLRYKYICGLTWGQIAKIINRSGSATRIKLHKRAIEKIKLQKHNV